MRIQLRILMLPMLLTACSILQTASEDILQQVGINTTERPHDESIEGDDDTIPDCSEDVNVPYFGTSPVALDDLASLIPLGNLNPPGHTFPTDHIYLFLRRSDPTDPVSVPVETNVFAPGDAWITSVVFVEHLYSDPPFTDYTIRFSPCRQLEAYFMHISSLSPELLTQIDPQQEPTCRQYTAGGSLYNYCELWGLQIPIQEGEVIGTAGGRMGQNALDLGAMDARVPPLAYANPSRHYSNPSGFDPFHVVCPIDYFEAEVRPQLMGLFGGWGDDPRRTIEPVCGEVMQDIPGTARGKWYLRGSIDPFPEDPHIALVHGNIDPTRAVFSVGTSVPGLESAPYYFDPQVEGIFNLDFSQITPGETIYCYSNFINRFGSPQNHLGFRLLLELTPESILRIEMQTGMDCGDGFYAFGENIAEFER